MMTPEDKKSARSDKWNGIGLALGGAVGLIIGNITIGLSIGVNIGASIGFIGGVVIIGVLQRQARND